MNDMTTAEVAQKVQAYIEGRQFDGISLEVEESGITKINGWWRVPVRPHTWPKSISAYYEALANVESEIDENDGLNILLSSSAPLEDEEEAMAGVKAA